MDEGECERALERWTGRKKWRSQRRATKQASGRRRAENESRNFEFVGVARHGAHTRRAQTGSTRRVAGGAPELYFYIRVIDEQERYTGEDEVRLATSSEMYTRTSFAATHTQRSMTRLPSHHKITNRKNFSSLTEYLIKRAERPNRRAPWATNACRSTSWRRVRCALPVSSRPGCAIIP